MTPGPPSSRAATVLACETPIPSLAARRRILDAHRLVVEAIDARNVPEHLLAPGFRMESHMSSVTDYSYHGAMGLRDWMNDVFEVFADDARFEVQEIVAVGHDHVVARFCISGHGGRSQMPLELRWVGVTWFRDGRAIRAAGFTSCAEAMNELRRP